MNIMVEIVETRHASVVQQNTPLYWHQRVVGRPSNDWQQRKNREDNTRKKPAQWSRLQYQTEHYIQVSDTDLHNGIRIFTHSNN